MSRRLLATLACACLIAGACASVEPQVTPTQVDEVSLRIDRLHRQMTDVAAAQRDATEAIPGVLEAVRQVDAFVAGMLDVERIRAVEDTWPRVDAAFTAADPTGLREGLVDVAVKVDQARTTLARARDALPEPWEHAYLDAEDEVLVAVRAYAEATDALVQVLQRHWDTYARVHAASAAFVAANEFYRSSQEAVQAYEVRVSRLLPALAAAQEEVRRYREAQAEHAQAVNAASRAAERVWAEHPAPAPSTTP